MMKASNASRVFFICVSLDGFVEILYNRFEFFVYTFVVKQSYVRYPSSASLKIIVEVAE
jgi:hypothetical protein